MPESNKNKNEIEIPPTESPDHLRQQIEFELKCFLYRMGIHVGAVGKIDELIGHQFKSYAVTGLTDAPNFDNEGLALWADQRADYILQWTYDQGKRRFTIPEGVKKLPDAE